ncbi:MAG: hypothetical protein M3R65_11845 [Gemmatimonadota bacterium]|nr:hypothetical protein [Gemmatimonadota bacterium]
MGHDKSTRRQYVVACSVIAILAASGCSASNSTSPGPTPTLLTGTYVLTSVNGVAVPTMILGNNSLRMFQDSIQAGTAIFQPGGVAHELEVKLTERPNTIVGGAFTTVQSYDDLYTFNTVGSAGFTIPEHGYTAAGADSIVTVTGSSSTDGSTVTLPIFIRSILTVNGSTTYGTTEFVGVFTKQ